MIYHCEFFVNENIIHNCFRNEEIERMIEDLEYDEDYCILRSKFEDYFFSFDIPDYKLPKMRLTNHFYSPNNTIFEFLKTNGKEELENYFAFRNSLGEMGCLERTKCLWFLERDSFFKFFFVWDHHTHEMQLENIEKNITRLVDESEILLDMKKRFQKLIQKMVGNAGKDNDLKKIIDRYLEVYI